MKPLASTSTVLIPTILCGGSGSRLWPISREQHPKPLIRINGGSSLLQKAYIRGAMLHNVNNILTVANREQLFKIEDEYREVAHLSENSVGKSFILEPFGRNTAPAIAAACIQVAESQGEGAILLILAADHLIANQEAFSEAVVKACELAQRGKLVTFGIQPAAPETSYGYIESKGYDVIRFVEKPSLDKAKEYLTSGNFHWNSGMFCFTAGSMLREMSEHCPEILTATRNCIECSRSASSEGFSQLELNSEYFELVPDDSIDYAVMEKTRNAAVVACDIGWSDVGCWRALGDLSAPDRSKNRIYGDAVVIDSCNCTITSEHRLVGVVGVDDLVIVDTPDALLVVDKQRTQDVKQLVAQLEALGHEAHKLHNTVHRPWGTYTVLHEGKGFKLKRIEVRPGAHLSLQSHKYRSEHWVVVSGKAEVTNGDELIELSANQSTYIPIGNKHSLYNSESDQLVLIEIQCGSYLGEDDIQRYE